MALILLNHCHQFLQNTKSKGQAFRVALVKLGAYLSFSYLRRWAMWWVRTTESWEYRELLGWFLNAWWDFNPAAYAAGLLHKAINEASAELGAARLQATH